MSVVVMVVFEHKMFQRVKEVHNGGMLGPLDRTVMPYVSKVLQLRETIGEGLGGDLEHLGRQTQILSYVAQCSEPI